MVSILVTQMARLRVGCGLGTVLFFVMVCWYHFVINHTQNSSDIQQIFNLNCLVNGLSCLNVYWWKKHRLGSGNDMSDRRRATGEHSDSILLFRKVATRVGKRYIFYFPFPCQWRVSLGRGYLGVFKLMRHSACLVEATAGNENEDVNKMKGIFLS